MIEKYSVSTQLAIYYNTIKYLKPIQIWGQIIFRLYQPKVKIQPALNLRQCSQSWIAPIKQNNFLSGNTIKFLNKSYDISSPDIWNRSDIDKLWLYNLHYFDILKVEKNNDAVLSDEKNNDVRLKEEKKNDSRLKEEKNNTLWLKDEKNNDWALEDKKSGNWQLSLMHRWIDENPPPYGNGWEPYTLSLRIINWVKWLLANPSHDNKILSSLATQANFLSKRLEIHILGNHLLANAKALIFAGLYFKGKKAEQWLKIGLRYFYQELSKQIYSDGGHCELSPMYHAMILEDLLDIINICNVYNKPVPHQWLTTAKKMFSWLKTMEHPDNDIALFNDAAFNVAPSSGNLHKYAARLNIVFDEKKEEYLNASGYIRLENHKMVLIADIGEIGPNYQPGHAHADTLSFELSIKKQRLFVNSGISTYNNCPERIIQRGTASHNTLTVNDMNSSFVWKSFRVAERAKVKNIQFVRHADEISVSASHNGYEKSYGVIHDRTWILQKNKLIILDKLTGKGRHKISIYFHIHPDIEILQLNDSVELYDCKKEQLSNSVQFYDGKNKQLHNRAQFSDCKDKQLKEENHLYNCRGEQLNNWVQFLDRQNKQLARLTTNHALALQPSTYHPEFNVTMANQKLVIESYHELPIELKSIIEWDD